MFVSVDLPIPGEPPSSTSDPGTIPPPSTRSSSPIPVDSRGTGDDVDLRERPRPSGPARRGAAGRPAARRGAASSTSVFHSEHPGHWPCQRGVECPQEEQTWMVVGRAMSGRTRLRPGPDDRPSPWHTRNERPEVGTWRHGTAARSGRATSRRARAASPSATALRGPVLLQEPLRGRRGHEPRGADRRRPRRLLHDGDEPHARHGRPPARGAQHRGPRRAAQRRRRARRSRR